MKLCALALVLSLAAACGRATSEAPVSDVPESFHLATPPAGAKPVGEVLASARSGDEVVVTGRVGGAVKVFVDGYAAFTIVDEAVLPCGEGKMDDCETPWDYCCDPPDVMAASSLSVELVADGRPLRANARGFHGLDHLKTVVVRGTVMKDEQGNARVLATGVHVQP